MCRRPATHKATCALQRADVCLYHHTVSDRCTRVATHLLAEQTNKGRRSGANQTNAHQQGPFDIAASYATYPFVNKLTSTNSKPTTSCALSRFTIGYKLITRVYRTPSYRVTSQRLTFTRTFYSTRTYRWPIFRTARLVCMQPSRYPADLAILTSTSCDTSHPSVSDFSRDIPSSVSVDF